MSITILPPDPEQSRPFYAVHQLETGAWGRGRYRWRAWLKMRRHKRYKTTLEGGSRARDVTRLLSYAAGLLVLIGAVAMVVIYFSRYDR